MGPEEWEFVVTKHHIPTAVAGFTPESLLAAFYSTLRQLLDNKPFLDNCYPQSVRPGGNPTAKKILNEVMDITDATWRGIGTISHSGYELKEAYSEHNARIQLPSHADNERKRIGEMPPGCDCTRVVLGKIYPTECRLYGAACTPQNPIGPCMVSDEGACRIWWSSGVREPSVKTG
jgi:hydrogenase expression/formation protein HypD